MTAEAEAWAARIFAIPNNQDLPPLPRVLPGMAGLFYGPSKFVDAANQVARQGYVDLLRFAFNAGRSTSTTAQTPLA